MAAPSVRRARPAWRRRPPLAPAERPCPYCGGELTGRYAAVEDWRFGIGPPADVYACERCGALAAGRVPHADEVASWYSEYYTHTAQPNRSRSLSWVWPTPRRRRELRQLQWYFADEGAPGRFLEVGTGSGERLVQFAEAGWAVVGQDVDAEAGGVARSRGIDIHRGPLGDIVGREEPFDLVGLNHVLEHVPDPAELLATAAALLVPGGRLCIVAPNARAFGRLVFGRWWFGMEQPRHLAIPTLESLDAVTSDLGLAVLLASSCSANANVILGRSLGRWFDQHLPSPGLRRAAHLGTALLGQAAGRAATLVDDRLGEEVVWVGQRRA